MKSNITVVEAPGARPLTACVRGSARKYGVHCTTNAPAGVFPMFLTVIDAVATRPWTTAPVGPGATEKLSMTRWTSGLATVTALISRLFALFVSLTALPVSTWTMVSKLPALVNTNGRDNVVVAPAARPLTDADGPVGAKTELLNCVTKPPVPHVPALRILMSTVAGCPCTGVVGENEIPAIWRSAHGVACAEACAVTRQDGAHTAAQMMSNRSSV